MATRDLYQDSHTIKVANSNTLTLEAQTVTVTNDINMNDATVEDLSVTGTLDAGTIQQLTTGVTINGGTVGVTISGVGGNVLLKTTSSGKVQLNSAEEVDIDSGTTVDITATTNVDIDASENVNIDAVEAVSLTGVSRVTVTSGSAILSMANGVVTFGNAGASSGTEDMLLTPDRRVRITNTNDSAGSISDVLRVENDWADSDCDGIYVRLRQSSDSNNVFVRFVSGTSASNTVRGRIRGTSSSSDVAFQADGSDGGGTVDAASEVVYASGASDFGEWLPVGDLEEWNPNQEQISYMEKNKPHLGLPEGYVCYVRDGAFYKEGPGTPMIVTRRACLVGNEVGDKEDFLGEIFSFSGQVNVIVKGPVKTGDLLTASGSYYCEPRNPSSISFDEYKKVIGTAWKSTEEDSEYTRVLCAIGVKNTF